RLVQGYFVCESLGKQPLRGVSDPIAVYQVRGKSGATSRLEVAQPRGLTPLVGRVSEVALLLERWEQVKAGQGHVVILTGDAGIGKSRLVQVLKERVTNEQHVRMECHGSPYYQNTVLYPVIDLFQRALRWQPEDTPHEKLRKLETTLSQYHLALTEAVPPPASPVSLALPGGRYPPLSSPPPRHRPKHPDTLLRCPAAAAAARPV